MPILNWLDRDKDLKAAEKVPYRLLEAVPELSYGDPDAENMLIQGDNLEALKALLPYYAGQVKCIYIDPPYNTRSAFEHYDDNLEHTKWLSMMYPRLELLRELLSEDGTIWVSIDDSEVHYLKAMMDEIFGRNNFINQITYERSGSAGLGQGGTFVDTAEYLLIYKKKNAVLNEGFEYRLLEHKVMKRYKKVLKEVGNKVLDRSFKSKSNGEEVKIFKHDGYVIDTISLKNFDQRETEIRGEYSKLYEYIFRTTNPQKENAFQTDVISQMNKDCLYTMEYIPSRGKYQGKKTTLYYFNKEIFAWLKDSAEKKEGRIVKKNKMTNIWRHEDIPKADLANEGGVDFKRGKKPENLIKRILELATVEGDLVLDSFAGSGSTGAGSHKLDRRWISVEIGEQASSHIVPRMRSVISGEDASGISKSSEWQGGGGFKFYRLGEAVFDAEGQINHGIKFEHLAAHIWFSETKGALSKQPNSPLLGVHNETAYYLLYNGILGDKRPQGGNVLTSKILESLPPHDGPKVIYGESSRIGPARLADENIVFKQTPYDVKAR